MTQPHLCTVVVPRRWRCAVTLFAWVILAGLVIAVAIAIDPIASISWSDPAPEVAVATTLSAGGADDEPGIVSIAGAATSGVTKASAAGAGSAGCMAGLRGAEPQKGNPKENHYRRRRDSADDYEVEQRSRFLLARSDHRVIFPRSAITVRR